MTAATVKKNHDLVLSNMWLLSSLSLVDEVKETLHRDGLVPTILTSVADYSKDTDVAEIGREVVELVVDEGTVSDTVRDMKSQITAALKNPGDTTALEASIARAAAFSVCPKFAEQMVRSNGVGELVRAMNEITRVKKCPRQETLLCGASAALVQISRSTAADEDLRQMMASSGVVAASIASVKEHPKLTAHVKAAVSFLEAYAQIPECAQEIAEGGGVEACVCALRANENEVAVVSSAVNTLVQLASTSRGAVSVARFGGTRQVISTIMANAGTPGFAQPMGEMIGLLQRVSTTAEGQDVLVKQGGVEAIIAASDSIGRGGGAATAVTAAASKTLGKLLTANDVDAAVREVCLAISTLVVPERAEELKHIMSRLGHMCGVSAANAETVVRGGGAASVAAIATRLLAPDVPEDMRADVLPAALAVRTRATLRAGGGGAPAYCCRCCWRGWCCTRRRSRASRARRSCRRTSTSRA